MKRSRTIQSVLLNIAAWVGSMFVIIPLALILLNAFKGNNETLTMTMQLPKTWNWENFRIVFEKGKLGRSFLNSFLYSCVSTFLTVFLGGMSAYVFSRRRSKKFSMVYMYIVLGMVIPVNYVSLMKVMQITGLNNTQHGIILLYTAMQTPFTVFLYYGFVSKIPVELDEAAVIDGCGPWELYFRVIW